LRRKSKKAKKSILKSILESLADRSNLLIRTIITKPFQALTTDITEIVYNNGKSKAYLCVFKDCFGQMVYGWELDDNMETKLVITAFRKARNSIKKLIKKIPNKLIIHQDQGSQYTSYEYVNEVLKNDIILSYSTPGTPTDNPGQESFFGRFKEENRDKFMEAKTLNKLKKLISKKIRYYDNERLHTSLKLESPRKFTLNFIKKLSIKIAK